MKKIYLLLLFAFCAFMANAQCTADSTLLNEPGYYPDALDTAKIDQHYSMTIQVRIPPDTNAIIFGQPVHADIDSIKVTNVVGLPTGFTYQCNTPGCVFEPYKTYCALIEGHPSASQSGTYPLKLALLAYAHGVIFGTPTSFPPQPDTIKRFSLVVGNGVATFVQNNPQALLDVKLYPNPADNYVNVVINSKIQDAVSYTITDIAGKEIKSEVLTGTAAQNIFTIALDSFSKGVYLLRVNSGDTHANTKFIVK